MPGMDAPASERIDREVIVATAASGHDFWDSVKVPILAAAKREADADAFQRGFDEGSATSFVRYCLVFIAGFGTAFFFAAL